MNAIWTGDVDLPVISWGTFSELSIGFPLRVISWIDTEILE